jgi:hypothetical protein
LPRGRGAVARAAHRAQPSNPPSPAIPPTAGHSPARGPSWFGLWPPTSPRSDRHTRDPHAPARWLQSPAGRISPPPSRANTGLLSSPRELLGGGHSIRPAGGAAISPEAAGSPACGSGAGCRGRGLLRTPRGPDPGRTAGSWPPESRRAASGGEQAPRGDPPAGQNKPSRSQRKRKPGPRGKRKPPRSGMKGTGRAPAGRVKSRHAVARKKAPPLPGPERPRNLLRHE